MLRYKRETRPGLVALYDIRPGNGAGPEPARGTMLRTTTTTNEDDGAGRQTTDDDDDDDDVDDDGDVGDL